MRIKINTALLSAVLLLSICTGVHANPALEPTAIAVSNETSKTNSNADRAKKIELIRKSLESNPSMFKIDSVIFPDKATKLEVINSNPDTSAVVKQQQTAAVEKYYALKRARFDELAKQHNLNLLQVYSELTVDALGNAWTMADYEFMWEMCYVMIQPAVKDLGGGGQKFGKAMDDAVTEFQTKLTPIKNTIEDEEAQGKFGPKQ